MRGTGKWLISARSDLLTLFVPVWITWAICFMLPESILLQEIPLWVWVILVLGIDVAHVWSTLFRTYLSPADRQRHRTVLIYTPLLAFTVFFILAWISTDWFWTILAYLAVYHFVKQQYGFMQIYRAKNRDFRRKWIGDKFVIYFSMLYPLLYWHLAPERNFDWFVTGDFLYLHHIPEAYLSSLFAAGNYLYFGILIFWVLEDVVRSDENFSLGKVLWVSTTAFNWYLGIVWFNSDLAFTITNVVAHGVPYFVLISYYVSRRERVTSEVHNARTTRQRRIMYRIGAMLLIVLILAFAEEYLWDMWIYRENEGFFGAVLSYPLERALQPGVIALLMGLLAVPQVSHYIFDGYIWKANEKNPELRDILLR